MGGDLSQKLFLMVNCLYRISYRRNRIGGARMPRFHDLHHSYPCACHHKPAAFCAKRFDHFRAIEARSV